MTDQTLPNETARPPLTVIVPVMNAAPYIAATLTSIARQDVPGVEVIVVDGASTDGTQDIVQACPLEGLRLVSQRDRGQLEALQTGVRMARGEVLTWINGDDIVMPGAFRTVLAALGANPAADFVYSDDCAFDEDKRGFYFGATIRGLGDWDHLLFYRQLYSECVYWRRSATRLLPDENYDLRVYTDYAFFLNLRWGRRGYWVPQRLGAFRIRSDQNSAAFSERKAREFDRIRREHRERIGMSPLRHGWLRSLYAPWFWARHIAYPMANRGLRKLGRVLTGDRRRKAMTKAFYDDWLRPSS